MFKKLIILVALGSLLSVTLFAARILNENSSRVAYQSASCKVIQLNPVTYLVEPDQSAHKIDCGLGTLGLKGRSWVMIASNSKLDEFYITIPQRSVQPTSVGQSSIYFLPMESVVVATDIGLSGDEVSLKINELALNSATYIPKQVYIFNEKQGMIDFFRVLILTLFTLLSIGVIFYEKKMPSLLRR